MWRLIEMNMWEPRRSWGIWHWWKVSFFLFLHTILHSKTPGVGYYHVVVIGENILAQRGGTWLALSHVANKWCKFSVGGCGTLCFLFSPGIFLIHILNLVPHENFLWSIKSILNSWTEHLEVRDNANMSLRVMCLECCCEPGLPLPWPGRPKDSASCLLILTPFALASFCSFTLQKLDKRCSLCLASYHKNNFLLCALSQLHSPLLRAQRGLLWPRCLGRHASPSCASTAPVYFVHSTSPTVLSSYWVWQTWMRAPGPSLTNVHHRGPSIHHSAWHKVKAIKNIFG